MRIDRCNAVTRVGAVVLLSLPLLASLDWLSPLIALVGETVLFLAGGIRPRELWRRARPIVVLAPLAGICMALYGRVGGAVLWQWGAIVVSERSLAAAIAVVLRVAAMAYPAVQLLAGIDPTDMADGLAQVWRLPARFVLGALAGVRLFGLFTRDWRSLGQARRARGLGDSGLLRRWVTMTFAMLVFALRRGSKLATAMEARGFGAGERTWARESPVVARDWWFLGCCAVIIAGAMAAAVVTGVFQFPWN